MRDHGLYRRAALSAGSVITLLLGLFLMSRNTERSPSLMGTLPNAPGVAGKRGEESPAMPTPPVEGAGHPLSQLAPTIEQMRSEVADDPEHTPVSLIRLSEETRRRTDQAIRDSSGPALEAMLKDLEGCVSNPEIATQAQVICVSNAERLAEKAPELEERVQALRAALSPGARRVLESLHRMKSGE